MTLALLHGTPTGALAHLQAALDQAGISPTPHAPAALLINLTQDADSAIDAATAFAAATPAGEEALIINLLAAHDAADWPATRARATLWAFTRHAALAWAPRGIRVNALGLGISPVSPDQPRESAGQAASATPAEPATLADITATILAFTRLRSMTGQLIRLGAPTLCPPA